MKKAGKGIAIVLAIVLILFLSVEIKPYEVHHSTIFTSGNLTEIKLYVVVNSLLTIDEEEVARKIVESHVSINGSRENAVYELEVYRTNIHYRQNWKYDTIFCDEKGNIFEMGPGFFAKNPDPISIYPVPFVIC